MCIYIYIYYTCIYLACGGVQLADDVDGLARVAGVGRDVMHQHGHLRVVHAILRRFGPSPPGPMSFWRRAFVGMRAVIRAFPPTNDYGGREASQAKYQDAT